MTRRPRLLAAALAATAVAAAAPATASADLALSDCDNPASSSVFSPWYDYTQYFLAPNGGFEAGASGWDVSGASVVSGNESYNLSGTGSKSLALSSGDAATSAAVCVGLEHPTFRFVARRTGGSPLSTLGVSVVLADGTSIPVGSTGGSSSWQPSPIMVVGANLLPLVSGGTSTEVSLRFAPNGGSWQVDDVFVDPRGGN